MKNPYRAGSQNAKIFGALLAAKVPSTVAAIARRTRMPQETVAQVLAALRNPVHNSVGRRAGVSVERKGDGYVVKKAKPQPKAKRARPTGKQTRKKARRRKAR